MVNHDFGRSRGGCSQDSFCTVYAGLSACRVRYMFAINRPSWLPQLTEFVMAVDKRTRTNLYVSNTYTSQIYIFFCFAKFYRQQSMPIKKVANSTESETGSKLLYASVVEIVVSYLHSKALRNELFYFKFVHDKLKIV